MKQAMSFLTGLVAGTLAGLILAPKPGTETRKQIKGFADKTGSQVGRMAKEAKEVAFEAVESGKEFIGKMGRHGDGREEEAAAAIDQADDVRQELHTA
ncbi:MAG: YtxH domain-containing protein [Nitrospiria bacterium]